MVHQSSLCYEDLIVRHFVVSSTSVRRARVINWKSVCVVLCYCVQYVEIYIEQRAIAAESYRLLREAYGEHAPWQGTCQQWFRRFKSGDFDTRQEERQGTWKTAKKFEDV